MNAILRQTLANFRTQKLQAMLNWLTLFAAATLLTIAMCTINLAQGAFDRLFQITNAPHLWLTLNPALPAEDVEATIATLPGVIETGRAYRTISSTMFLGEIWESGPALRDWPDITDTVGRPLLTSGRAPQPGETGVIVLERNHSLDYGVVVGDFIGVLTPNGRQDLQVIGLYVSTEVCPTCFPFVNYVTPGTMNELGLFSPKENDVGALEIGLRLQEPSKTQVALDSAKAALPPGTIWSWEEWQDLRSYADSSVQLQRILLFTFAVIAGFSAGFLVANTIRGTLQAQTRQIGLLKSIGFTNWQLILIFLFGFLVLALLSSIAGVVVGNLIASLSLGDITKLFGDSLVRFTPWSIIVTPITILSLTTIFTLLALRNSVRLDAVHAIRFGEEQPHKHNSHLGSGLLGRIPLSLAVGLQEILVQPARAALTIVGIVTAVITVVAAFTLGTTFNVILSDPAQIGFDGDLSLRRSSYISETETLAIIAEQPDIQAIYSERWQSFRFPGEENYYHARFREGDLEAFRFPIIEGRMFQGHGEAVAGYGLVTQRGIQVGDQIHIYFDEKTIAVQIVGLYRENSNLGRMLMLPSETLRLVTPDFESSTYIIKLKPDADPYGVSSRLSQASNDFLSVRVFGEEGLPGYLLSLPKIMVALTVVLAGIAALGVFMSVWMTVQERQRTYGVFTSIGMTTRQVILAVLAGVAVLALIAYLIGLPLGLIGIHTLMDNISRSIGFGPLELWTETSYLILMLPVVVMIALTGAFIPAYRAGRSCAVKLLSYE